MMKTALLVAFTANVLLIVSVQGTPKHKPITDSESSASSYSSSSSSLSSSSSNASSSSSSHSSSNNCGNKKCPGPNEEYDECPAPCPPRRCDVDDRLIRCKAPPKKGDPECEPGCRCSDNYYRNDKGICVLREHCPKNGTCKQNEVYDLCPAKCPFRTCGIDDNLIDCIPSPNVGDPDCPPPACRCANGFFKDDQGNCVEWDKCPKCNNPNEEYDACPAPCPPRECGVDPSVILCLVPPKLGDPECKPGCRCSDNYVRNDEGICIPKEQCPNKPVCGQNEVFSECPEAICRPQHCTQKGRPFPCASLDARSCIKGCVCAPDYLRNSDGKCIPEDQCNEPVPEPLCEQNEVYSNCTQAICRHLDCTQKGGPIVCASIAEGSCIEGCVCAPDYLRNSDWNCIPEDQCDEPVPEPLCEQNEVFSNCTQAICRHLDCTQKGGPIVCAAIAAGSCIEGCVCAPDYLRNSNGNCVPEDRCDATVSCGGDPNAEPGCGVNCGRLCSNYKNAKEVACPAICKLNGCDCKEGYVLNTDTNLCVLPEQCPKPEDECNRPNEEYQECPNCSPGTCESIGRIYDCPLQNATNCKGACRCKPGYYYNKIGECITEDQCLQCIGKNEFYSCGSACDNVCATLNEQNRTNCPIINKKCNEKCYCEDGYARDENNVCVPVDECKPAEDECNRPNEEYQECPNCSPGTCESIGKIYHCPLQNTTNCKGACRCKPGYYYNKIGDCITEDQCLQCNGKNEFYSCGSACDNVCATLDKQNRTNCPIINIKCNEKCYCEDGYARDENNVCVPVDECKPHVTCTKPNEEYQECANCSPGTCESIGKSYSCPAVCIGACRCKPGYYYNKIGECITEEQCLRCNGSNEFYSCGQECDNVCADLDKQNRTNCPIINVKCNEKCYCEDGYARDDNNICVPVDHCKPTSCGGDPNAEPGCGTNCGKLCSSNGKPGTGVACSHACSVNGCDCKDGYLFDKNIGKCVKPSDCTLPCGKNEQYSDCVNGGCDKRLCSQIDKPAICIDPIKCEGGCICRPGYLRDANGVCIPEKKCPKPPKCPVNEEFVDCLEDVCRIQDCSQKGHVIACAAVVPDVCTKGCLCSKGYLRNCNGTCVPEDQCEAPKCPVNEEFVDCLEGVCRIQDCSQKGHEIACAAVVPDVCTKGCLCSKGYLRNCNGTCVPEDQCEAPKCPVNEEFVDCLEGVCRIQDCSQKGHEIACAAVVPDVCTKGCLCSKGYLRNCNGTCVPEDQCEAPKCSANEEFSKCIEGVCRIQDCSQKGQEISCAAVVPEVCTEGCLCSKGNLRNSNGTCVPEDQCEVCPEGERFSNCPPVYREDCNSEFCPKSRNDPPTCPTTRQCGKPKCVCGYLDKRNRETGKCVRASDCPPFKCDGPNEEYQSCPAGCPGESCTDYLENTQCSKYKMGIVVPCKPACRCLKGFYRNSEGICVDSSKCTECPEGEVYSKCPPTQCDAEYCPVSRDSPLTCPESKKCTRPRCICGFNSHRDRLTGKCIPTSKCPPFPCDGKNEVYNSCPPACPGQNCTDYINKTKCPKFRIGIVVPCKPACRCEKDTYRNSKGVCVSGDECECDN